MPWGSVSQSYRRSKLNQDLVLTSQNASDAVLHVSIQIGQVTRLAEVQPPGHLVPGSSHGLLNHCLWSFLADSLQHWIYLIELEPDCAGDKLLAGVDGGL